MTERETGFYFTRSMKISFFDGDEIKINHRIVSENHTPPLDIDPIYQAKSVNRICSKCKSFRNVYLSSISKSEDTKELSISCSLSDNGAYILSDYPKTLTGGRVNCPLVEAGLLKKL